MDQFRVFIKDRLDIGGPSISSADLRVTSFHIRVDALTKATSTFQVLRVPSAVKEGDVLCLYNPKGKVLYKGVITRIGEEIQCDQIQSLFNDSWIWKDPKLPILEDTLIKILTDDFKNNADPLMKKTFDFDFEKLSDTGIGLPRQDPQYVINFEEFIYSLFEKYGILFYFDISFENKKPKISLGRKNFTKIKLSNNTDSVPSIETVTEIYETNKLIVYSTENEYRGTWYGTANGITDDPYDLSRFPKIKTNIVFSDDTINIIKAQNLRNDMYNHQITVDMLLDGTLYDFWEFELGQQFDLFVQNKYFNTIFTGYELSYQDRALSNVTMTFGMVRTRLEDKLYKNLKV